MFKPIFALSLLAIQFNTHANSKFSQLPIDMASPTGVFESNHGWRYAVGLGVELESEYHGSDQTATEVEPYLEAAYRTENWEFQSNIVNNRLFYQLNNDWYLATWLNIEQGRDEDEATNGALAGMGVIDDMLEIGGGISYHPTKRLTLSLFGQGYTNGDPDKGFVGFAFAHYRLYDSQQWKIDLSADLSFADSDHLTTEFGVTEQQAQTSAYDLYLIDSGVKSYGIGINGVYALNDTMMLYFNADYEVLASESADSPLIKAGSDTEIEAGVRFIYRF